LDNSRYFWFAIGIAYGAMLGAYVGRRLLLQRQEFETVRSRVWELEARERERVVRTPEPARPD
jgi:hypothetical protein